MAKKKEPTCLHCGKRFTLLRPYAAEAPNAFHADCLEAFFRGSAAEEAEILQDEIDAAHPTPQTEH